MDYSDAVQVLIESESKKIKNQIFNIGYQNLSILEIGKFSKKSCRKKISRKRQH